MRCSAPAVLLPSAWCSERLIKRGTAKCRLFKIEAVAGSAFPALKINKLLSTSLCVALSAIAIGHAHAGATIKVGDEGSLSIGGGLRTSFNSVEDGAPNGTSASNDFVIDNVRLYLGGQINKHIGVTFNTERRGNGDFPDGIQVLDAIARFEFNDSFNIWGGRMLPPSDRANLDGPFYLSAWQYPGVVSNYPNLAVGRDNGLLIWGKPLAQKLVYSVGVFEGHNGVAGGSNDSDNLLYAGRLAFNFLAPEPTPAYYTASTYYGGKDILTLGLVYQYQKDGVGTSARRDDFSAWSIDALFEKNLSGIGVITLEGAYYNYDLSGAPIAVRANRALPPVPVDATSAGRSTVMLISRASLTCFRERSAGANFSLTCVISALIAICRIPPSSRLISA